MSRQRIETHLHTMYSLLDGTANPQEFCDEAKKLGMPAIAITDHGTCAGVFHFYNTCKKNDIIPIIGCELYMAYDENDTYKDGRGTTRFCRRHLCVYAKNQIGLENLYKLSSMGWNNYSGKPIVFLQELLDHSEGLVIASACIMSVIHNEDKMDIIAQILKQTFKDDFYLEIQPLDLTHDWDKKLKTFIPGNHNPQLEYNKKVIELSKKHDIKILTTMDAHYPSKDWKKIQDIFILNSFAGKSGWHFYGNVHHLMDKEECWDEFVKYGHDKIFTRQEYEKSIDNSYEIIEKCKDLKLEQPETLRHFPIKEHRYYEEDDDAQSLIMKCILNHRHAGLLEQENYIERLKFELDIIEKKDFFDYFLIVEDIINHNNEQEWLVGPGRGSVGGSLLAYMMGIHHEDPIKYGLLFERFMSIDRNDFPDIDIDFEKQDETKQYIRKKYGVDNVADVGPYQIMRLKTAVKDPYRVIAKDRPDYSFQEINSITGQIGIKPLDCSEIEYYEKLMNEDSRFFNKKLFDFINREENAELEGAVLKMLEKVRVLKKHPCAMVISDKPISTLLPIFKEKPNKPEECTISEFDGNFCQQAGLIKFDILGLNTLRDVSNCIKLIKERKNIEMGVYNKLGLDLKDKIDIYNDIPLDDEQTLLSFARGDTDTIFQFNTPLLKNYLRKIGKKGKEQLHFEDLVAINSLTRPGPLEAGFADLYIDRRHNKVAINEMPGGKKIRYRHDKLDEITKHTHGVIIYQEQIMQAFGALGGFDPAKQNQVRKAVAKSKTKELEKFRKDFYSYATTKLDPVWTEEEAKEFFEDMIGFGRYAFNRSHAVEYSHLSYICQFLKVHFPTEWWSGVLKNSSENDVKVIIKNLEDPDFILPPCVNNSEAVFNLEDDKIRMPIIYYDGIGDGAIKDIISKRPFSSLEDFVKRTNGRSVRMKSIVNLISVGALDSISNGSSREQMVVDVYTLKKKPLPEEYEFILEDKSIIKSIMMKTDPFFSFDLLEEYKYKFASNVIDISKIKKMSAGIKVTTGGEIKKIENKKTKNGKDFCKIIISNNDIDITVMCWSNNLFMLEKHEIDRAGQIVQINGTINAFNDNNNLVMNSIKLIKIG